MYITALVILAVLSVPFYYFLRSRLRSRKIRLLLRQPFPPSWEEILTRTVALYSLLPDDLKEQLRNDIRIFLAEKRFEGLGGLKMTDEIRVTIAAEACMLLLNRDTRDYPGLTSILVYPFSYVAHESVPVGGGVVAEGPVVRLGESWKHGSVVLAWDNVRQGALNPSDGHNVVLHEFAHQLDQEDGVADGAPILERASRYGVWAAAMNAEFSRLQSDTSHHRKNVMDSYGATNPAEFFAVATETFFEKPLQLRKRSPALYRELRDFYRVDPAEWFEHAS